MVLVSGNYGLGKITLADDRFIIYETGAEIPFKNIKSVGSEVHTNKKQSILSVLIGLIILTPILFLLFNIIGLVIGIVLSLMGSQYSTKSYSAEVTFNDDTKLKVDCSKWDVNTLNSLKQNANHLSPPPSYFSG